MEHLGRITTITLTLFAVIDILGSIPVILQIIRQQGPIHPEKSTITSALLMIAFLFLGEKILGMVGIDVSSFAMAGAIVIFLLSLEMVLDRNLFKGNNDLAVGSVVPVAFPLIAGAGTLTTLISLRSAYETWEILIGIVVNLLVVYVVLRTIPRIEQLLGKNGIAVFRKVFGVILMALAIKLFKNNLFL